MSGMIERFPARPALPDLFGWVDPAKDVETTVTECVPTLRAERTEETAEKHRAEFRHGTFTRSVGLPAGARRARRRPRRTTTVC